MNFLTKYDIGKLLSEKVDIHTLKTEEHAKGVFFTDGYGYLLNKLWGVRIKHKDSPSESVLFYSFILREDDGSHVIEERYPFENMKLRPKKHFLLFDSETLKKDRIQQIFQVPESSTTLRMESQKIYNLLPEITNRREREKTVAKCKIQNQCLDITVFKHEKNLKKKIFCEGNISCICEDETPVMFFLVNAFTLRTVIELFICYNVITLIVTNDKIMVTGEEGDVQVVIARMK